MTKSDKSIHSICISAIKRKTISPYDFKWTKFYESNLEFQESYPGFPIDLENDEQIICSVVIDADNLSILTTKRLITKENGVDISGTLTGAVNKAYNDFKSLKKLHTFGIITLQNGIDLKYFIETGKPSMVMIYGIRTLLRIKNV